MNNKDEQKEQILTLVRNKMENICDLANQIPLSERFFPSSEVEYLDARYTSFIAVIYAYAAGEQADKRVLDILCLDFLDKIDSNHTLFDEETLQMFVQNGALVVDTVLDMATTRLGFGSTFGRVTPNVPIDFLLNKFQQPLDEIYMCGEPFLTSCIQSKNAHWIVDEIDGVIWAIDVVRSYLHGWNATINHTEITIDQKYNKIVCFHPYSSNKEQSIKFLNTVYDKVEMGGEMVIVTHTAALFGYPYKNLRKYWLKEGVLREVYDLGDGWIANTGVVTSVLVLQKPELRKSFFASTPRNREIRFVDLADYAKTNHLSREQMRKMLCKSDLKVYEECVSATCTNEDLLKDDMVNLSPSKIVAQVKSEKISNAVRLADILLDDKVKVITQTTYLDLTTEFIAQNINSSLEVDLSTCPTRKSEKEQLVQHIDFDAVIMSSISGKIKPFLYRHKGNEPIVLSRSWLVLRLPKDSDTTLDYLVTEMSLDYFAKQAKALNSGSIISRLTRRDLHQLYIVLPPTKEEQQARLRENRDKMLTGILEAQSAMLKDLLKLEKEKYVNTIGTRKHTMKNLLMASRNTINELSFVVDSDTQLANYIVFEPMNTTLKDYIDNLKTNINRLSSIVKHLVDVEPDNDIHLEVVEIVDFIAKWVQVSRPLNSKYKVRVENRLEVEDVEVEISTRFTEVLDNIFGNAIKHGFKDTARQDYVIRIIYEVTENGDLSIKFANNGSGLAEGMTEDSVFDYSQTSGNGEGIGGWHVREIVKQSHGSVILHYNPTAEDGFMIDYEIILPTI